MLAIWLFLFFFFFFQAEDGIRDYKVTGVQTCALPISTILLTSHYMQDVTALASRVLIINRGQLLYDGALAALVARIARTKRIELVLADGVTADALAAFGDVKQLDRKSVV